MLVMFKRVIALGLSCLLVASTSAENLPSVARGDAQPPAQATGETTRVLTEAAIIALIIAGSIAAYKAMGKPCACPKDLMRDGRVCGGNSAWSKPGGYRPLCVPSDVTPAMISAYHATKAIPALK
jgi:hypothetical protein